MSYNTIVINTLAPLPLKRPPFVPLPEPLPPQAADSMTNTFLSLFKNVL